MNFGVIMKNYAWKHGLAEDLNRDRLMPFITEAGGAQLSEKRFEKATARFEQLRAQMGKRWKIEGHDGTAKKKKR